MQPMHLLTLRFRDPEAEAAFATGQALKAVRPARAVLVALLLITVATNWGAAAFAPDARAIVPRVFAPSLVFYALCLATTWTTAFVRYHQAVLATMVLGATAVILNLVFWYPHERLLAAGFFFPAMHIVALYALLGVRLPVATPLGWGTAGAYVALAYWHHDVAGIALARQGAALVFANLVGMLIGWNVETATRHAFLASREVERERARSDALLLNILPGPIAEQLKASASTIAQEHPSATVLFADIVGFTEWCARHPPEAVVQLLDRVFTAFDSLATDHGLEKIKTIGDCYMAVAGVPAPRTDHAHAALAMARDMLGAAATFSRESGEPLRLRVGLSSGPVVAGVIGRSKFIFDLWGDTVNTASRMESHGEPDRIQCSEATAALLEGVALQPRDAIEVRGKGTMRVFLVA